MLLFSKDEFTSSTNPIFKFIALTLQDEFKKLCDRTCILSNLALGGGIQDREAFAWESVITVYAVYGSRVGEDLPA